MLPMIYDELKLSPGDSPMTNLADRLEGLITRRACGQIRDLHVVCLEDRIVLQGWSRTYHAKQLAQEAALDETGGTPSLANEIVVC